MTRLVEIVWHLNGKHATRGARAESNVGISASWPGTQCSEALANTRSGGTSGTQAAMSPTANWNVGKRSRADASIASDRSIPTIAARHSAGLKLRS
jgi:hypothetical protein